jgi:TolA-binding protein
MNGILLPIVLAAAIWPFGRDRDHAQDTTGTIKDLESKVVVVDKRAQINGSEGKAMESYRLFLDLASADPLLRAEAMRRLADLELETADIDELQQNIEGLGDQATASVELYRQLLAAYPNYAKNDLVLYQLARAYEANGDADQALATLDRLVGEYPNAPYYDEAQFRRGEILFISRRYAEAERAYRQVLKTGAKSAFYEQALYKHGWTLFKELQYEQSLESFFGLLDRKLDPRSEDVDPALVYSSMGRADQELVSDTLRVLSISFSYLEGADSISAYFKAHGPRPYAYVVYTNLGDLYLDKQRYQDAAAAYRAFVDLDPYNAKAPLLQAEVIEAYKQGGFPALVLEGKQDFVERYGPASPYWQRYTYADQPEAVAHLKANLNDLAAYHHAEAQKDHDVTEFATAARWYRTYLESFPDDENAAATNFLLAEVLFESGNYRDAALQYERTAYGYPYHERSAEAGYAALLAYGREEPSLQGAERDAWHRQSIESALRFAATYPEHEQAPAVQTDAAEKLYAMNDFARAREAARQVVERTPAVDDKLQRTAWTVIAHSEFDQGDFSDAETAYGKLIAFIPPDDPAHAEIVDRVASSIYKQGEQARTAGDLEAAVQHFLRVGRAAPSSTIRATAQYDAAAALIQLEQWSRAATVLEDFRGRFPDSELAGDVGAKLAVAYLQSGESTRAAGEFERIADSGGSPDIQKEALWQAAELYAGAGNGSAAAAAYSRYVERYPSPAAEAIEARQHLVELSADDYSVRMKWLREIVSADAAAGAERTDRTRYLAAKAQLTLAEPTRDAFLAVRLVAPLDKSLKLKQERMQEALAAFGKAADYGIAEVTTASTYETAELYHALSRDLFASERPKDLSAEELEQYDILLEEQAFPFEEEAIKIHELNAARTADGTYDEWVKKSMQELAELVPVRYAKDEIGETFVATIR